MQTINSKQFVQTETGNVAQPNETVNQEAALQASPPAPTFLQRFCQKLDQIFTLRCLLRLIALTIFIGGACIDPTPLSGALISIIVAGAAWKYSNGVGDVPLFGFSKLCQASS